MSQKFISLDDASTRLGVTKDRLNQLREGGDLRAYRDGASWKFRTEDIERFESEGLPGSDDDELSLDDDDDLTLSAPLESLAAEADTPDHDETDIGLGVEPLDDGDDAESILLTGDQEPEGGLPRPQSTIIGKSELSLESDLKLASDSDDAPPALDAASASGTSFDDVEELELDLDEESGLMGSSGGPSSAKSASAESIEGAVSADEDLDLGDLELDLSGSDMQSGSDVLSGQESAVLDNQSLSGAGSVAGLSGIDSVQLSVDEDDDLVLGGDSEASGSGSDSGIDLSPSDSGFALDEVPLDLGGSAIGSALDLASLSAVSGVGAGKPAMDSGSVGEGDFQLTPSEMTEEDEDSSQIVALEDVGEEDEDLPGFEAADDDAGFGAAIASEPATAAPVHASAAQETPFPAWVLGMLGAGFFAMLLAGVMAMDLVQSMWAWDEPYAISSSVMDGLLSLVGQ